MSKLSLVIPVFNEEQTVLELYQRISRALATFFLSFSHEIIFIDDGSSDDTHKILTSCAKQDNRLCLLRLSRNFGHHSAITAGLDHATGDYVVLMDGDLQDQPEEIYKLYAKLLEGYDVVYGERITKQFSWFRIKSSQFFLWLLKKLINQKIEINTTIFRIMTREVVQALKKCREQHRYIVGLIGWVGFSHGSVPVIHGKRFAGQSKYPLSKQLALAFDAIIAFSDYPLRLITRFGFVLVFFSACWTAYIIFKRLWWGVSVIGWASIMVSILFVGGMNILLLGIIGSYVGRMYVQTKQRPLYILRR